jgi:hypothetical protein
MRFMFDHSSEESREWAEAMLCELDFIESHWAALWWALGCTTAIFRQSGRDVVRLLRRLAGVRTGVKEASMNEGGRKAIGFASGVGLAAAVAAVAVGILFLAFSLFPAIETSGMQWLHLLIGVFIPETIFVVAIIALWHKRRPMALGILLFGAAAGLHVLVHFARHWRG